MGISKHYGEWFEVRNNPKCSFGEWEELSISGPSFNVNPDVYLGGQRARYHAMAIMGLEGKNMWRGYSRDTGEPPGNEAGEANAEGSRLWFGLYFRHRGEIVGKVQFTLTGEHCYCWWFGSLELGKDGNQHPCAIFQVSKYQMTTWARETGWLQNYSTPPS